MKLYEVIKVVNEIRHQAVILLSFLQMLIAVSIYRHEIGLPYAFPLRNTGNESAGSIAYF